MAKTVKPTAAEAKLIKKRLMKTYPQMFEGGKMKPGYAGKKLKKTARTQAVETQLKNSGLSDDAIARLRGW